MQFVRHVTKYQNFLSYQFWRLNIQGQDVMKFGALDAREGICHMPVSDRWFDGTVGTSWLIEASLPSVAILEWQSCTLVCVWFQISLHNNTSQRMESAVITSFYLGNLNKKTLVISTKKTQKSLGAISEWQRKLILREIWTCRLPHCGGLRTQMEELAVKHAQNCNYSTGFY